ncbi:hypothetical protein B0T17DRAFT_102339 [Bombardia bombarda]|uniref:Uncharacterized protein n=1 Tax=Bombardia bombarda TaxID=252184 RepID=A0AA39XNB7_9PEZI|nr:hypothetical protein B0T17DRAFT_102339 [Bombardia bombarda]
MPFDCARAVCATFCHAFAGALIPLFGPRFPSECILKCSPNYGRMKIDPSIILRSKREAEIFRLRYGGPPSFDHLPSGSDSPRSPELLAQHIRSRRHLVSDNSGYAYRGVLITDSPGSNAIETDYEAYSHTNSRTPVLSTSSWPAFDELSLRRTSVAAPAVAHSSPGWTAVNHRHQNPIHQVHPSRPQQQQYQQQLHAPARHDEAFRGIVSNNNSPHELPDPCLSALPRFPAGLHGNQKHYHPRPPRTSTPAIRPHSSAATSVGVTPISQQPPSAAPPLPSPFGDRRERRATYDDDGYDASESQGGVSSPESTSSNDGEKGERHQRKEKIAANNEENISSSASPTPTATALITAPSTPNIVATKTAPDADLGGADVEMAERSTINNNKSRKSTRDLTLEQNAVLALMHLGSRSASSSSRGSSPSDAAGHGHSRHNRRRHWSINDDKMMIDGASGSGNVADLSSSSSSSPSSSEDEDKNASGGGNGRKAKKRQKLVASSAG